MKRSFQSAARVLCGAVTLAAAACATPEFVSVPPALETDPVRSANDAADDPAIWIHPVEPSRSRIIGTDKQAGLYVYDLGGKVVQFLPDGRLNNVDLRYGFPLGTDSVDLVAASERTRGGIALYRIDPEDGRLVDVAAGPQLSGLPAIYGMCMYRSRRSGRYYVFASDESGLVRQWELYEGGGRVHMREVREFAVGSQAEGCAADDDSGALYVAEEGVALWRYEAEPDGGDRRVPVMRVGEHPSLAADLEGVAIYYGAAGAGYVIVSSQGNNSYAVFERAGENRYLGSFAIGANVADRIDGASDTDGIEVTSAPLGAAFPRGLFLAQDGRNTLPSASQNFKLIGWEAIATALGLTSDTSRDPRGR